MSRQSDLTKVLDRVDAVEIEARKGKRPMFAVEWWGGKRSAIPAGAVPADGQELLRSLYPDAAAEIAKWDQAIVPVTHDADWFGNVALRGYFTIGVMGGDGTKFRVPDYNGKMADSLGAVFMRGDGKNAASAGQIQGDAIRNITGRFARGNGAGMTADAYVADRVLEGAFTTDTSSTFASVLTASPLANSRVLGFDASRVVPTANENRPVAATGCWIIWLFGSVTNAGAADAAALATAYAQLASRMSVLEQRKSTCLVNAVGTGAPHETVSDALPANVTTNSRYVLANPFGINTPVQVVAEVMYNGAWAETGWLYAQSIDSGYGVRGMYKQGEGIIVQTGNGSLLARNTRIGCGHIVTVDDVKSLPCRVFVRKMEA